MKMIDDELLDELVFAYEDMRDYVNHSDFVKWSQEKENKAIETYSKLREEVLKRMVGKGMTNFIKEVQ